MSPGYDQGDFDNEADNDDCRAIGIVAKEMEMWESVRCLQPKTRVAGNINFSRRT